jgi:hypothetical protein
MPMEDIRLLLITIEKKRLVELPCDFCSTLSSKTSNFTKLFKVHRQESFQKQAYYRTTRSTRPREIISPRLRLQLACEHRPAARQHRLDDDDIAASEKHIVIPHLPWLPQPLLPLPYHWFGPSRASKAKQPPATGLALYPSYEPISCSLPSRPTFVSVQNLSLNGTLFFRLAT